MSAEPTVSQRLFDEVCKRYDDQIGQLRADLKELREEREDDIKAAVGIAVAAALKEAFTEIAEKRDKSLVRRIGAVGAGAGVVAAWVGVMELWRSLGR